MKLTKLHSILTRSTKGDDADDDDKKSIRYRRRFFSRSGRRSPPSALEKPTGRYRRRVSSRAGRCNRAQAHVRKRLEGVAGDFDFESDTDSQTTLSSDEDEGEHDTTVVHYNVPLSVTKPSDFCVIPTVITTEDETSDNTNNSTDYNQNDPVADPTYSNPNIVGSEGHTSSHPQETRPSLPQIDLPAVITVEESFENDKKVRTDFDTKCNTISHRTDEDPSRQYVEEEKHEQEIAVRENIVSPKQSNVPSSKDFMDFRLKYLIVYAAIMLADGLQGTHLYALYSGYGYTVANLYSIGFITGAVTSPFTGPLVDRFGRKKSAMFYCFFEIIINVIEQYENFWGLIASRMIGGITTNLLSTVFESWLATEHRRRKFDGDGAEEPRLGLVMRDSTIVSRFAAIASGYIAHYLAAKSGNGGPFAGAVFFTCIALVVVFCLWTENYGNTTADDASETSGENAYELMTFRSHMVGAFNTIVGDTTISRIGLIEGLTEGTLQTFVFLWSPALAHFALSAPQAAIGMGEGAEPAYGLIFGWFMACGVVGGIVQPYVQEYVTMSGWEDSNTVLTEGKRTHHERGRDQSTIQTGYLLTISYIFTALLFLIPALVDAQSPYAFSFSLLAFLVYEILVGIYLPCQGVIRSVFMPKESTCSVMTMLRIVVNVAVALGVVSTNYVSFTNAFATLSMMMLAAAGLQLSIIHQSTIKS